MDTNNRKDTENKIYKGWRAWHALKTRLSGITGLTMIDRGTLIVTMVRSAICYGLESRGLAPKDLSMLEVFEGKVVRLATCCPLWVMQ